MVPVNRKKKYLDSIFIISGVFTVDTPSWETRYWMSCFYKTISLVKRVRYVHLGVSIINLGGIEHLVVSISRVGVFMKTVLKCVYLELLLPVY